MSRLISASSCTIRCHIRAWGKARVDSAHVDSAHPLLGPRFRAPKKMAEGQPPGGPPPSLAGKQPMSAVAAAQAKRPPPNPLVVARSKFVKAREEQAEAESHLQQTNEAMQTRAADIVKALRKELVDKQYQSALVKINLLLRERTCPTSCRLGTRSELDDLLAGRRPLGAGTYLFRWAFKQTAATAEDILIVECAMQAAGTELTSEIIMEQHGERYRFNQPDTLRHFISYVYATGSDEGEDMNDAQLGALCNCFLLALTEDVIKMAEILNTSYMPPNSFPSECNLYYQWILSHMSPPKAH